MENVFTLNEITDLALDTYNTLIYLHKLFNDYDYLKRANVLIDLLKEVHSNPTGLRIIAI